MVGAAGLWRGPEKRPVLGICALGHGGGKSQTWSLMSPNPFMQDPVLSCLSLFCAGLRPGSFLFAPRTNSSPVTADLWVLTSKPIFWSQLWLVCDPRALGMALAGRQDELPQKTSRILDRLSPFCSTISCSCWLPCGSSSLINLRGLSCAQTLGTALSYFYFILLFLQAHRFPSCGINGGARQ